MEFTSSSSSFSKSKSGWTHDVFISFRGEDTRDSFVSHLHSGLSNAGVNAFFDELSLLRGMELEQLLQAIEGSQISLVVFSRSYIRSTWCLDELVKIIECHETHGQKVVPIFYYVDPHVIRNQVDDYDLALTTREQQTLKGEHMERVLSRWGGALTKASNFSGWDVKNHRNEAELVKKIVEDILTQLDNALLSITEFPVGLEPRVQEVTGYIENQSTSVCIIGIWGMGGSGKTTIAKTIYNQIHRRFSYRSFIENIREVCDTDGSGHVHLQEQLISDVTKTKVKLHSVGMGKTMIENKLSGKRALIVLDDANEFEQLKHLCGNRNWFGQGSVVIITTRDLHLLRLLKVDYVYDMQKMDKNESIELFSWHAFREAKPVEDYNEVSRNVVAYCGGLPLALEVLGSYLMKRTKKEWTSVLSKLEIIPNDQVQEKLRISFDGLHDEMEKDIFLDVCCFFIGKDRAYVTDILNGCGLHADIGIPVLIERSLIKVEKNNKLGMHHLLRDMGREIIREHSMKEPGKRSRLWFCEDVLDVLTTNTGTEAIEGLVLKMHFSSRDCFETYSFEEMKRLRLLQLCHVQLTGDFGHLSKHLRWICWQGFPLKYIPNNFYLKAVIALDLKHSRLRLLWKKPQVLRWLKILNLSHSRYLTQTPDFSELPILEKLILKDCPSLCKIHHSIGDLHNLLLINLEDCTSLSNLPRETYKLKSVKTLILSGCSKIDKLEEEIGQMKSLTMLMAENTAVKQVPLSIVSSKSIGYISLCGYEGLARNVFPSIIWSWMSPTMNPLSFTRSFGGISSNLVSMDMLNNDLGDLAPMVRSLSNLRSVLMQCDTEFQLSKQVHTITDELYGLNSAELEITSEASWRSYVIGIGSYQDVFNTLSKSIYEGLAMATSESSDVSLPGDNYPYWLAHVGDGHSVYFVVPEGHHMKGMTLCVLYLSTPDNSGTDYLVSVLMVNYTKRTIQLFKKDTVISFNNVDWQGIKSHLGSGDKLEFFVIFRHGLVVKKTAIYLMCDESIDMEMEPSPDPNKNSFMEMEPSPDPNKNAFIRFIWKFIFCKR